jgi:hypothetical protein
MKSAENKWNSLLGHKPCAWPHVLRALHILKSSQGSCSRARALYTLLYAACTYKKEKSDLSDLGKMCDHQYVIRVGEKVFFPINTIFHPETMLLDLNSLEEYMYDPSNQTWRFLALSTRLKPIFFTLCMFNLNYF